VLGRAGFQAILPLRGKILNVEKAALHKIVEHREIEAIWTAIGTGFIGEEFDAAKLRYDKIIIMTDADVDGSHIRTLLLTFFYRKMPELVKQGHVYVANPPLYKILYGKNFRYVHSEAELKAEKLQLGSSIMSLELDGRIYEKAELAELTENMRQLELELVGEDGTSSLDLAALVRTREEHGAWPTHYVHLLSEKLDPNRFSSSGLRILGGQDLDELYLVGGEEEVNRLIQKLKEDQPELVIHLGGEVPDRRHGCPHRDALPLRALQAAGGEARSSRHPAPRLRRRRARKVLVHGKGEPQTVQGLREALSAIEEGGKSRAEIKRFKGLGEMEPDELWESTMDPEKRMLYEVRLEDAAEADKLFAILMGSVVEPRRAFIEQHALEVTELDV
jgi:DNA gyrase subunit B